MKKLLAVNIDGPWVGGWHRVRGNEHGIVVHSRAEDEEITLEIEHENRMEVLVLYLGLNQIDLLGAMRFRLVRASHEVALPPMTVELVTNGSSPS